MGIAESHNRSRSGYSSDYIQSHSPSETYQIPYSRVDSGTLCAERFHSEPNQKSLFIHFILRGQSGITQAVSCYACFKLVTNAIR